MKDIKSLLKKLNSQDKTTKEDTGRDYLAEQLEPRVLYSGTVAPDVSVDDQPVQEAPSTPDNQPEAIGADGAPATAIVAAQQASAEMQQFVSEGIQIASGETDISEDQSVVLLDAGAFSARGGTVGGLTQEVAAGVLDAAAERWSVSGVLTDQQADALGDFSVQVADLEGDLLLSVSEDNSTILLDIDAAGREWFVDGTPLDDSEFTNRVSLNGFRADSGAAVAGVDVLTVLMESQGQLLGLDSVSSGREVSATGIEDGLRRIPFADESLTNPDAVTTSLVADLANAAAQRWENSGLDAAQLEALVNIEYRVVDLQSGIIGSAENGVISIDIDAAGKGWFVDLSPEEDSEFDVEVSATSLRATGGSASEGVDLLSVILHEQGHILGLEHVEDSTTVTIMTDLFSEGNRRLLEVGQAEGSTPGSLDGVHLATTNLISEDFESPDYAANTRFDSIANPEFAGWTATRENATWLRESGGDKPGPAGNQLIQFEWDNAELDYVVTAPTWTAGDVFTLTMDVAPMSWGGTNQRWIDPSLNQNGGAAEWSASTPVSLWSGTANWETVQYIIPTAGFTSGQDVTLKIDHSGQRGIYVDNVSLTVGDAPADNDAPTPDPLTWSVAPEVGDYGTITMTASNASDPFGVEYYFENTTRGTNSGWQDSNAWTEVGLDPDTEYTYRVQARDKSPNQNATAWSDPASATTPVVPDGTIIATGFEAPSYSNGTGNPGFAGWTYENGGSVKSRVAANQSDVPYNVSGSDAEAISGVDANQLIQFEWTNAKASHAIAAGSWGAGETLSLTLDASPQSWGGQNQRYIEPSILDGSTVLWSASEAVPLYNSFGRNDFTTDQNFEWTISTDDLISGGATEGEGLTLKLAHSGQRGIYIDNVLLRSVVSSLDAVDDDYTTSNTITEDEVLNMGSSGSVLINDSGTGLDAPTLITGVTVPTDSANLSGQNGGFNRLAGYVVDGSGFDGTAHNNTASGGMWMESNGDKTTGFITFDLGANYDLDNVHVWNYNEFLSNRGANEVEILVSNAVGGTFTSLGDYNFAQAPGTNGYLGEVIDLSDKPAANDARMVRFNIKSNHGGDEMGLSEVRFYAADTDTSLVSYDAISANGAVVAVNPDGTFTYDPTGAQTIQDLNDGDTLTDTFTYTIAGEETAVIYEGFADSNSTLGGNATGKGLVGNWNAGSFSVEPGSLSFGSLPTSGNQVSNSAGNLQLAGATIGPELNAEGLLDDGAELWFSFLTDNTAGTNTAVEFALGTDRVRFFGGIQDGGEGIGVNVWRGSQARAATWEPGRAEASSTGNIASDTTALVVGKITWGATAVDADTIEIFLPGTDLTLPGTAVSTRSAVLDQMQFDTLSFDGKNGDAPRIDEIRLGATYEDVLGPKTDSATVSIEVSGVNEAASLAAVDDDYTITNPTDEDTVLTITNTPNSLLTLDSMATGDYQFTADGETFEARVEQHDGAGWLLIGRGREGWEFDTDGQGNIADVNQGLGTSAAFDPAAYSDAMINELLANAGLTMADVEVRLSRASNPDGTAEYQDVRWRDFTGNGDNWTWAFDNSGSFGGITYELVDAAGVTGATSGQSDTGNNTRDMGLNGNDGDRVFTWAWGGHGNQKGFSYGQTVSNGANTPTSFLWESGNENHAIPYTEVYIRVLNGTQIAASSGILANDTLPAAAAELISGVTIEDVSSELTSGFNRDADYVLDGSGLNGGQHGTGPDGFMWLNNGTFTSPNDTLPAQITFDLGENYDLDNFHVWNYNEVNLPNRGANLVEILVSDSEGGAFSSLGDFTFDQATGQPTYAGQTIDLSAFAEADNTRLIRFNIKSNHGGGNQFVGLSEVQFFGNSTADGPIVGIQGTDSLTGISDKGAAVTVNPDGSFTYDPTASAQLQGLAAGEVTTDTFTYTIIEDGGVLPLGGVFDDLELWLDASDINGDGSAVADGTVITDWKDKSGNGHDANVVQSDPNFVADGLNGNGVVNFDGNDQISLSDDLRDSLSDPDGSYTLITVARYTGGQNNRVITVDSGENWLFGFHGGQSNRWYTDGWVNLDDPATGADTDWHVHTGLMDGAPADPQGFFYRDGVLQTDTASGNGNANGRGGNNLESNFQPDKLALGGWNANSEFSKSEVAEVIMFDRLLTDAERLAVEAYLEAKYDFANDGGGAVAETSTATVTVTVNGVNDAPEANDDTYTTNEDTAFGAGEPPLSLLNLDALAPGDYAFTADGESFEARVEQHDGAGWLLIGRGREGWEFDTDGQGNIADVNQGLGTSTAFDPAAYSDAMINDLLAQSGLTLADVEIRLSRASTPNGTGEYQDVRLSNFSGFPNSNTEFTFNFDNTSRTATFDLKNAPAGLSGADIRTFTTDTHDTYNNGGNDADRIFTWAWGGHNNEKGFSYGQSVTGADDGTTFIWDHPNNGFNHAIPYTEVYIRALNGTQIAPSLLSNDSDIDISDDLEIISAQGSALTGGTVTVASDRGATVTVRNDGSFDYDPTGSAQLQALAAGETINDTFTYTISDGSRVADPQDYRDRVLSLNPVAYYTMDEADVTGSSVENLGSLTNTATLRGGATFTGAMGGVFGGGLSIDDTNTEYLQVDNGEIDINSTWTISAWFSDVHANNDWRTLTRGSTGDHQIIIENGSNDLGIYANGNGNFRDSGYDLPAGDSTWQHIAAVGSASTITYYINGVEVGTSDRSSTTNIKSIGAFLDGRQPFAQTIDEFAVFDQALSAEDILALLGNASDTATVTVTVTGMNDAPVIDVGASDQEGAVTENASDPAATETDSGTISFIDVDLTDSHTADATFTSTTHTGGQLGSMTASVTTAATSNIAPLGTAGNDGYNAVWGDPTNYINDGVWAWNASNGFHADGSNDTTRLWVTWTEDYIIDEVELWHCEAGPQYIASDYQIQTLNAGGDPTVDGDWTTLVDVVGNTEVNPTYTFTPVTTAGVRLFVTNDGASAPLRFEEIIVNGKPAEGEVTWEYEVDNSAIQFLAVGETVTETYTVAVSDGHPELITGVTVGGVSSQLVGGPFNRQAGFVVDGSGLTGDQHGNVTDGSMWLSNNEETPVITFDLEGNYDLGRMHVWNYNEVNLPNRGANLVEIWVAESVGGPFTSLGDFNFSQADGTNTYAGEEISLAGVGATNVRLVRFDIKSDHGGDNYTGLSEVQFFTAPGSDTATVEVTITGTNDAPVIDVGASDQEGAVTEDASDPAATETDSGTVSFSDVDLTDAHTADAMFTSTTHTGGQLGTMTASVTTNANASPVVPITVPNFSFETGLSGWTRVGGGGTYAPGGADYLETAPLASPAEGNQVAYLETGTAQPGAVTLTSASSLATVEAGTTYDLTVAVGHRNFDAVGGRRPDDYLIELLVDGNVVASNALSDAHTNIPSGEWADLSASFTAASDGGSLTVRLSHSSNDPTFRQGAFDNVRLTATPQGEVTWNYEVDNAAIQFLAAGETVTETYTVAVSDGHPELITGVTVEEFSSQLLGGPFNRQAGFAVDGSGLTGDQHGNAPEGSMWLSNNEETPVITFDLEGNYDLEKLHVWNYNEVNLPNRGANLVEILVAETVGGPFTSLGDFNFSQADGTNTYAGEEISLAGVGATNVRLVRFNIKSDHGGDNYTGLSEVQFFDTGASDTATVEVTITGTNDAPVVSDLTGAPINENEVATISGTITDPDVSDTHTVIIDWDDDNNAVDSSFILDATGSLLGKTFNSTTDGAVLTIDSLPADLEKGIIHFTVTGHQYQDDGKAEATFSAAGNGTPFDVSTVSVTVSDTIVSDSEDFELTVSNVIPVLTNVDVTPDVINENGSVTVTGNIVDPGTLDTFRVSVSWGDGKSDVIDLAAGSTSFNFNHVYDVGGRNYTITVKLLDDDLGVATTTLDVGVINVPPALEVNAIPDVVVGETSVLTGSFTDPGLVSPHTVVVDWGDGTSSSFEVPPTGTLEAGDTVRGSDGSILTVTDVDITTGEVNFTVSHEYENDGIFNVSISVSDGVFTVTAQLTATVFLIGPTDTTPGIFTNQDGENNLVGILSIFRNMGDTGLFVGFRADDAEDDRLLDGFESQEGTPDFLGDLTLAPFFAGTTQPGATVVVILRDEVGNEVASTTIISDLAGNWTATFPELEYDEGDYNVEIQVTNPIWSSIAGSFESQIAVFNGSLLGAANGFEGLTAGQIIGIAVDTQALDQALQNEKGLGKQ